MTEWVLIFWVCFSGCGTSTIEGFTTKSSCEQTLQELRQQAKEERPRPHVGGVCTRR